MAPWLALAAALSMAGCAGVGKREAGAERLAREWAAAIAADEPRAAYDLLASSVRQHKSFDAFLAEWKESRVERARLSAALTAALRGGARMGERAEVTLRDGQKAQLERDGAGWHLQRPLAASVRPGTPEEALRRLADALEERSFPAVMSLLSSERQDAARQLIDSFASGLRAHAADLIEVTEDRATLVWTDGSRRWRVVLKREQGAWHIDDFSPQ